MPPVLTIALTGGIGSGKTSIASIFKSLGVPIIDSDTISKEIILPGKPCFKDIVNEFGEEILTNKGTIDRYKLRDIIFNNDKARIKLENITHPIIFKNIDIQTSLINYPYCLVIVPLLIETKSVKYFDKVLLVDTFKNIQFERVSKRDSMSPTLLKKIIKIQATRSERLKYADDIIENNNEIGNLNEYINILHKKYLTLSKEKFT
jgi:dephospho-CoA kinase